MWNREEKTPFLNMTWGKGFKVLAVHLHSIFGKNPSPVMIILHLFRLLSSNLPPNILNILTSAKFYFNLRQVFIFFVFNSTFARFCLCAYLDKFSFAIFINGPSGCDNMDAWNKKEKFIRSRVAGLQREALSEGI